MRSEDPLTAPAAAPASVGPLVGRTAELDRLRAVVSGAAAAGDALLLSGEAGIGKSALLAAAREAARADGLTVLSATGSEVPPDLAFATLGRALRSLHHLTPALTAAQRDVLAAVWSWSATPSQHLRVLGAVLPLLREAAARRPVLLVVDDLQWVDEASAVALALVTRRLAGSPVRFLAAARTGEAGVVARARIPEHEVAPLDGHAAAQLLHGRFPRLAPRVARRVLAEAGGNPLALSELPSALTEAQRAGLRPLPAVLPLGRTLRALHGPPVADLPASTRRPLLLAALEGTGDLDPVVAACGEQGVDHLAPAERAGLVRVDRAARRLAFRHPLVRSAVVDGAAGPERRRAHRELADGLAHDLPRRAWHLAEAAGGPDEDLARRVERAARRARRTGDGAGAVSGLLRAADLGGPGPDRGRRLAEAACLGAAVTGDLERVGPLLAEAGAPDRSGPAPLSATVAAAWLLLHRDGDVVGTHRLLVGAIGAEPTAGGAPDDVVEDALHLALEACLRGGRPDQWQALGVLAARYPDLSPDLHLLLDVLADPARVTAAAVERLDREVRGLWRETDPARVVRVATAALAVGRAAECRAALWKVVDDGRAGGAVTSAIRALTLLGADGVLTGRWDEAVQLADEGVDLCTAHGYRLLAGPLRLVRAQVAAARGDLGTVGTLLAEVDDRAAARGDRALVGAVHRVSALVALAGGDPERAYRHAGALGPAGALPAHDHPALAVALDLVEAARATGRTGRTGEAARHARALRQAPLAALSPRSALLAAGAEAMATSPDDAAADLFEEALAVPGGDRWAFEHARIQLAYGEHLRRHRAIGPARRHLGGALATFHRLSAGPWAARAREELRAVGSRSGTAAGGDRVASLTPEEHEVAALAASGLTNKEIGRRLHLSHRTVSARLYHAFPKLGVTSRAGLRDALAGGDTADRPAP